VRHLSRRTERAYLDWIRRFWLFTNRRDPALLGPSEVTAFLSDLAVNQRVAAATQNQALAALLFLHRHVLGQDLPWLDNLVRASRPQHLPVVLSRSEVRDVLSHMVGVPRLMALLLYGAGLRLLEYCHLRVKDVDFDRNQLTIRRGKGAKDRMTMLPSTAKADLAVHLEPVRAQHQRDLAKAAGFVELPHSLAAKLPNAARECVWQWVFPATRHYLHKESGEPRAPCALPSAPPASASARRATPSAIRSRRTCSKTAATSAPCKSCSATRASRRR